MNIDVPTDAGPGQLIVNAPRGPRAVLLLGHGAGGGIDSFDLSALADELPGRGIAVVRFAQPWLVAGRKVAGPPPSLDAAWRAALPVVAKKWRGKPLIVGGRSAGARVACRCFEPPALGVITLAFPLHPPGKPEKSRLDEIAGVAPLLAITGDKDPFGTTAEMRAALGEDTAQLQIVEVAAGHSLQPGKRSDPDGAARTIVDAAAGFIESLVD